MTEARLREEMCAVGASLFARGYVHATAGNISVRLDDGFLITPTDACLGRLDPAALAKVDAGGQLIGGDRPSKTLALHRKIYAADPQARCVLHTHSTQLVALALTGVWSAQDIVPPITPYFVMKVGHVPLIPYGRPGDPAVGERVGRTIAAFQERGLRLSAVMLDRLGPNVWGTDPFRTMATLEELEETAKLWLACGRSCDPLDAAQIEELRLAFGVSW